MIPSLLLFTAFSKEVVHALPLTSVWRSQGQALTQGSLVVCKKAIQCQDSLRFSSTIARESNLGSLMSSFLTQSYSFPLYFLIWLTTQMKGKGFPQWLNEVPGLTSMSYTSVVAVMLYKGLQLSFNTGFLHFRLFCFEFHFHYGKWHFSFLTLELLLYPHNLQCFCQDDLCSHKLHINYAK